MHKPVLLPFSLLLLLALYLCASHVSAQLSSLWPLPQSVKSGSNLVIVDQPNFFFAINGEPNSYSKNRVIASAFDRYQNLIFGHKSKHHLIKAGRDAGSSKISSINVLIPPEALEEESLQLGVDESYVLKVDEKSVVVKCSTVWGALRGLETFSQLVEFDYSEIHYVINSVPIFISDQPRFPWRGLLVDSSRHFLSVKTVLHIIDSLSYSKFNTMHWHLTDDVSFAVQVAEYPLLAQKGSYKYPEATYSSDDIRTIVEYAYLRGVRIVPEFDSPGHTGAVGIGYPEALANCTNEYYRIFSPISKFGYELYSGIMDAFAKLFPDNYIHLGGDEVNADCWLDDEAIAEFMKQKGWGNDTDFVRAYFQKNIEPLYQKNNRTAVFWQEVMYNDPNYSPPADSIGEGWGDDTALYKIVSLGYRGIASYGWYLDQQRPNDASYYEWEDTWKMFYDNEPITAQFSQKDEDLVIGGEGCMWGEQVDQTNFDSRVWPRACAIAERLWSDKTVNSTDAALPRLVQHRCRLVQRGVGAGPLEADYCPDVY